MKMNGVSAGRGCLWIQKSSACHDKQLPKAKYDIPGEAELVAEFIKELEYGPREISSLNGSLANKFNAIVRKNVSSPFLCDGKNDGSLKTWLAECGFVMSPVCNRNQTWLHLPGYVAEDTSTSHQRVPTKVDRTKDESTHCAGVPGKVCKPRRCRNVWKEKKSAAGISEKGGSTESEILQTAVVDEVQVDGSTSALLQPVLGSEDEHGNSQEALEDDEEGPIEIEIVESDSVSMWTVASLGDDCDHEQENEDAAWVVLS